MSHRRLSLLVAFSACLLLGAGPTPTLPQRLGQLPAGLGVNIHFTDPKPGEMKMLADAGFTWVRMDFGWGGTERKKGEYDFAAYDRLMAALDEVHIRPVFILDYSNHSYDDDLSPHTDEGRAAFARWAAAAVEHFKGRGVIWEMYNEPNIQFWRPKPNVDDYAKLALEVGKAIRKAAPDEVYIGPATSTLDFKFLEACFKAGCLEYWSAVSVHPYRQMNPETAMADYARLRDLIQQYAPAGRQIPIVSGEWGYSAGWKNFDEDKQGRELPREFLTNVMAGVPISIWYDWHDDGADPKEPEHHFGTVHHEYHAGRDPVYDPKPAYLAMKALTATLHGATFDKRIDLPNPDDFVLRFNTPHGTAVVAWTAGKAHEAHVPVPPGAVRALGHTGEPHPDLVAGPDGLTLNLTDAPQYLIAR